MLAESPVGTPAPRKGRSARSVHNLRVAALLALALAQSAAAPIRPPAVPLVAHDPYFSVWSFADRLNEDPTRHWTGKDQPLTSLVRIDGKAYRLMGKGPDAVPALPQTGLRVTPTQTRYSFAGEGVTVDLTFTTPVLPDDVEVLSRPATYLTWRAASRDGKPHGVTVYFGASAVLTVNDPKQAVVWGRGKGGFLAIRGDDQPVLQKKGDDLRIDWGHLLLAGGAKGYVGESQAATAEFLQDGRLPGDEPSRPEPAANVVAAAILPFGPVTTPVSKHLILAYDDEFSIQFMGHDLRPYWRRPRKDGGAMDAAGLLQAAARDYARLVVRCDLFDRDLTADLVRAGGADYAAIATLAYRQSLAAQKVVADANGQPLMFSKEDFSNGCISTVDVLYPAAPELLLFSPTLVKASLVPIMEYAASSRWRWPFAPHDLGTYPKANGQAYGGGERTEENQMPVEESGNLLILLAALAKAEGDANFSAKYWPQLEKWADYLAKEGFDPASQLSTDDFAGHLAHNVNLSAKAIEALGAYAMLAGMRGKAEEATKYRTLARGFAERWTREAKEGNHTRLAFDKPDTWSQKYNLVWDRILGLDLFPSTVARDETAFYLTKLNPYGLPLDSRADYTKLDWEVWTATLADRPADFQAIVGPIARFLNDTPDRVPMTDWYFTSEPKQRGFQARSVVGGVFVKMLADPYTWRKYALRDRTPVGPWAPLPAPPVVTEVVPTARTAASEWSYTFEAPKEGWSEPGFDASAWKRGQGGFGKGDDRGGAIRTEWVGDDVWIRRAFDLPAGTIEEVQLSVAHDDGAEVYVNGVLAVRLPGAAGYETVGLPKAVRATLKPGHNVIAIHGHDDGGDKYLDAGFVVSRLAP